MGVVYRRIPLQITADFLPDGSIVPKSLSLNKSTFVIDEVLSRIKRKPRNVVCNSPIEYTIMVRGREKKIYYEEETNTWFSVKEIWT